MISRSAKIWLGLFLLLVIAVALAALTEKYYGPLPAVVAGAATAVIGTALLYWEGTLAEGRHGPEALLPAAILWSTPRAVLAVDQERCLLLANPAAESLLGLKGGQEQNRDYRPLVEKSLGTAGVDIMERLFRRVLTERKTCEPGELATVLAGEKRFLMIEGRPVFLESGQICHVAFSIQDVSSQREMEERLRRVETLSLVGQLAAGMAHEIRNPLTAVRGFAQLLGQKTDERLAEYLKIMLQELDRANGIIEEFLCLARPTPAQLQAGDLQGLLEEVAQLASNEAFLRGVSVEQDFSAELPALTFDHQQLKQVFLNLIQNALAAMPGGGSLRLSILWEPGDREVRVEVADSGVGMSDAVLARLGQPFFTTKENGTGLGLSISYRIIHEHGGRVEVQSAPGQGSTFTLIFPVVLPEVLGKLPDQRIYQA